MGKYISFHFKLISIRDMPEDSRSQNVCGAVFALQQRNLAAILEMSWI